MGDGRPGRPLRVGVIGATDRVRRRLEALFDGPGRGAFVTVEPPAAEVLVVDLDGAGAEAAWAAHRGYAPQTPTLLIGSDPARLPAGPRSLVKPLSPQGLLDSLLAAAAERPEATEVLPTSPRRCLPPLGEVRPSGSDGGARPLARTPRPGPSAPGEPLTERLDPRLLTAELPAATELCGEGDDLDLNDPGQVAGLFLPIEGRLLGAALAGAERFAAGAEGWVLRIGEGSVRVAPRGGPVQASFSTHTLRELCQPTLRGVEAQPDSAAGPPARPPTRGASWESLEAFLWQLALWTYRGRLPSGTAVHGRVYLAHWPNLTRLAEVPHGLRIAALWLAQPVSLAFTAQALGIRQRYVFAFYGAARTVGLAGQARRAADHLFQAAPFGPGADGRVLSGVISRLRGLVGA